MGAGTKNTGQLQNVGRFKIKTRSKQRRVIRIGPEMSDIIVIEGEAQNINETVNWKSNHGIQSSEIFDSWARRDT